MRIQVDAVDRLGKPLRLGDRLRYHGGWIYPEMIMRLEWDEHENALFVANTKETGYRASIRWSAERSFLKQMTKVSKRFRLLNPRPGGYA